MSTKSKSYHHGDVPRSLMKAAINSIKKEGIDRLSLRALARSIGVSQTTPYRHFSDKTHLLATIATEGFNELVVELSVYSSKPFTQNNLLNMGLCYVQFAKNNPEKYKLMFGSSIENRRDYNELIEASHSATACINQQIKKGIAANELVAVKSELLSKSCWTMVHGISALLIDGFYDNLQEDFDTFAKNQIALWLRGITSTPKPFKKLNKSTKKI